MEPRVEPQKKVRGIRLRTFNLVMILVACVLYAFLLRLTALVSDRYDEMIVATDEYIRCEQAAALVRRGSDVLTETSRMYVVTEDMTYAEDYFSEANETRSRDRGLAELEKFHTDDEIHEYLETALNYSNELMDREIYAMALTARAVGAPPAEMPEELRERTLTAADLSLDQEEMLAQAREMMLGDGYKTAKALITTNIDYCLKSTLSALETQYAVSMDNLERAIQRQRLCCSLLFLMNVLMFIFITVLIIRPLQIYIRNIRENRAMEIMGAYEFKYLALTYNDIYELNMANEVMLRSQAERDGLTGIMNRASYDKFQGNLQKCPVPATMVLIDVDKFKGINDAYGHAVGDQILQRVARLLSSSFRSDDFVARLGGDEFCVLITNFSGDPRDIIQKKVDAMNAALRRGEEGLPAASLSVGVASREDGLSDKLYRMADKALYASKESGRGRCSFWQDLPEETREKRGV